MFTDQFSTPLVIKAVAYQLRHHVTFGDVRASNLAISSRLGISKYPSLLVVCDEKGLAVVTYDGEFKVEAIVSFLDGFKSGEACEAARSESKKCLDNARKTFSSESMDFSKVSSIYYGS